MTDFIQRGKASFILGGQFGSEGKGAAAAYIAAHEFRSIDIVATNAGVQSGHTSIHGGKKRVLFHLPTAAIVIADHFNGPRPAIYLNAGSIIDPDVLYKELKETCLEDSTGFYIHPNAAVITQECKDAEMRADSAQTKIASTRKGVGEALARKVLRSGLVARDHPYLKQFVRRIDLNERMRGGQSVLVEIPQGFSLGIDQPFYPHTTSRNCTVGQAMSDAGIHPQFYGESMLVVRTKPIRVGNIEKQPSKIGTADGPMGISGSLLGQSGGAYPGQKELTWEQLGQTPEITTVTKRVRRVFDFSVKQVLDAMAATRPSFIFLSFCDYLKDEHEVQHLIDKINDIAVTLGMPSPTIFKAYGPATSDVRLAQTGG